MGTMSKFIPKTKRFQAGKANPRATEANRVQSGLLLKDMLAVMQFRGQYFNRKTRRYVFALWRRHARNLPGFQRHSQGASGREVLGRKFASEFILPPMPAKIMAVGRYKGVKIEMDHPSMVARRFQIRMS